MCVVCQKREEKDKLLRFTFKDGHLLWDRKMRLGGRGAYVCRKWECLEKLKNWKMIKRLSYSLRRNVPLEEVGLLLAQLREEEGFYSEG
jgi:predicted RNA-binding protein YlxR (DUF448 family)